MYAVMLAIALTLSQLEHPIAESSNFANAALHSLHGRLQMKCKLAVSGAMRPALVQK